jgi:hypothetical protein
MLGETSSDGVVSDSQSCCYGTCAVVRGEGERERE